MSRKYTTVSKKTALENPPAGGFFVSADLYDQINSMNHKQTSHKVTSQGPLNGRTFRLVSGNRLMFYSRTGPPGGNRFVGPDKNTLDTNFYADMQPFQSTMVYGKWTKGKNAGKTFARTKGYPTVTTKNLKIMADYMVEKNKANLPAGYKLKVPGYLPKLLKYATWDAAKNAIKRAINNQSSVLAPIHFNNLNFGNIKVAQPPRYKRKIKRSNYVSKVNVNHPAYRARASGSGANNANMEL